MKLSDFDYSLPKELIAQFPLQERDSARLFVFNRKDNAISHRVFRDIIGYINAGDLFILNDTKVLPCRLMGNRATGGRVEILLLGQNSGLSFDALIKPARVRAGERIVFPGSRITAQIISRNQVVFDAADKREVYSLGQMPIPPYIKREPAEIDTDFYQTIYARNEGAVASPTAGLHFTQELLDKIKAAGVEIAYVTLHVGQATFKPVKSEDITAHKMETEEFTIPQETIKLIRQTHQRKGRVFAVGTTSLRAIESYALGKNGGKTDLFIYPGYKFALADCLLTNFHLPRTTLFMLVSAFMGEVWAKKAYQQAIEHKYRFYSYGDAMLII